MSRRLGTYWLLGLLLLGCNREDPHLVVFTAASAQPALAELAETFERQTGHTVEIQAAASSVLARQIQQGAPADLFLTADASWAERLIQGGQAESAIPLLGNRMVLIGPSGSGPIDLKAEAPAGRFAMADPSHVPAGRYGQESLMNLGWWSQMSNQLVPAADVRGALRLVQMGEADLGLVYASDAVGAEGIQVRATLPESSHSPIVYALVLLNSPNTTARTLVTYLQSPEAKTVFQKYGFIPPPQTR